MSATTVINRLLKICSSGNYGRQKMQILVLNGLRALERGLHTPTNSTGSTIPLSPFPEMHM